MSAQGGLAREGAIAAADRAAGVVWEAAGGPDAFGWRDALGGIGADVLAQRVALGGPAMPAEQLYGFLVRVAGEPGARSWTEVRPAVRVSIEVFRATFLALERERLNAVAILREQQAVVERHRQRSSGRIVSMVDRRRGQ